jgi:hypothetical protein
MSAELKSAWKNPQAEDYLFCALETGRWLRSIETKTPNGGFWVKNSNGDREKGHIVPDEIRVEPGYGPGVAGIGTALIHLYLAGKGRVPVLRFPGEPYCTGAADPG